MGWNFDVNFREAKPGPSFEFLCQHPRGLAVFFEVANPFLPARHVLQHRCQIEGVGVVAKDLFAKSGVFELMAADFRFSRFVESCKDNAWPTDHSAFQHFVRLLARTPQIRATLDRPAQNIVHGNIRDGNRVFQDIDPLFCVEAAHLFQRFQTWGNI